METTDQDRKDAAFLTEGALKLIGQILVKHQAAVLSEFRVLHADLQSRDATIERLRAELAEAKELHIMQMAGISTAALMNTREAAKERIGKDNPYWTQAYQDVCDAVDREMTHREAALAARQGG